MAVAIQTLDEFLKGVFVENCLKNFAFKGKQEIYEDCLLSRSGSAQEREHEEEIFLDGSDLLRASGMHTLSSYNTLCIKNTLYRQAYTLLIQFSILYTCTRNPSAKIPYELYRHAYTLLLQYFILFTGMYLPLLP